MMLSEILKLIDKMSELLTLRNASKRAILDDHLTPTFDAMESVQINYVKSLDKLIALSEDEHARTNLENAMRSMKVDLEHVRIKVNAYANAARTNEKFPESARHFFDSCIAYFQRMNHCTTSLTISPALRQAEYEGMFTYLGRLVESGSIHFDNKFMEQFQHEMRFLRSAIVHEWEGVSTNYARCRQELS